ncbi:MAG: helix-turn-helix domain-containing protein [Thermoleophilaceae bacterium]|nr:helix-turn-helix domain-containing protein [Thermoleophilaceae bacterium]
MTPSGRPMDALPSGEASSGEGRGQGRPVSAAQVQLDAHQVGDLARRVAVLVRSAEPRNQSPWRDAKGIAAYLDVSVKTVHRLSSAAVPPDRRIPFHRLGGQGEKRFDVREVDRWLRGRRDRRA